ncbi:hypothetical protein EJ08DRAFT_672837 [Tothia fuscella]|uniref:Uncharacterized protein n=1 Tax=Tothia fuscella TaxID=1048955 RepID=A0A9P4TUL1_9PEZI|nr:hypothetical protein EJ08DRAFT_672837 [Tothia fuscella]
MHEEHPHPLLAQLPLTVSPFLNLPTATPLPYTYKSLPSTLPPSVTDPTPSSQPQTNSPHPDSQHQSSQQCQQQAAYVISPSTGHSAHPDSIIASCHALQAHLTKLQEDARRTVEKWENGIRERELMEKRRVAPGWLDVGNEGRMLVPERKREDGGKEVEDIMDMDVGTGERGLKEGAGRQGDGGEELDRAFGGLGLR